MTQHKHYAFYRIENPPWQSELRNAKHPELVAINHFRKPRVDPAQVLWAHESALNFLLHRPVNDPGNRVDTTMPALSDDNKSDMPGYPKFNYWRFAELDKMFICEDILSWGWSHIEWKDVRTLKKQLNDLRTIGLKEYTDTRVNLNP